MLKLNKKISATIASLYMCTFYSVAGDNPVNCRDEVVGQQSIYEGWASCSVSGYTLEKFVFATSSSKATITDLINGQWYSCQANVPFLNKVDIIQEVCDYTPNSKLSTSTFNPLGEQAWARLSSNSTDRDGSISSHEWFVNGVKQSNGNSIVTFPIYSSGYRTIKLIVTDNDGYKSTSTRSVNFSAAPTCGEFC